MKRGTKIWLIIALIFALAGGGLCIAAVSMGITKADIRQMAEENSFSLGNWHIFRRIHHNNTLLENSRGLDEKVPLRDINSLEMLQINLDYGKLTVKGLPAGKEAYIDAGSYGDYFQWSVQDGTITVETIDKDYLSFLDLDMPEATLYLPENSGFHNISLDVDAGTCDIEASLKCEYLLADADAGSVNVKNIQADTVELDCDAGKIELTGQVEKGGIAQVDAGKISLEISGADEKDYNYDIDVSAGSLSVNDHSFNGIEERRYIDNNADKEWLFDCEAGKIDVKINK